MIPAEALFEVENYDHYVQIQSEAALREMATKYPYDAIEEEGHRRNNSLQPSRCSRSGAPDFRGSRGLARAGIEVLEARD